MIKREKDMFLKNRDLEELYTMKSFPVYCGVTDQDRHEDQFADMKWMISVGSGMVQLGELLPQEILYSQSHNSGYGSIWQKHHREFADFLHNYAGERGILEVGGGNGILNALYTAKWGVFRGPLLIRRRSVLLMGAVPTISGNSIPMN